MEREAINCDSVLTIYLKAGDIIPIKFNSIASANIINYTEGSIFVSETNDFVLKDGVGNYLTITDGNCYNEYLFYKSGKNKLYVKADADGFICIIRKIW